MASFYRVIQYVPDAVRDERINLGVIVFDEQRVLVRLLKPEAWPRVEAFGGPYSREFFEEWARPFQDWTPQQAKDGESHYMSCLQLSSPRASLTTAHALLDRIGDRMLVEEDFLTPPVP